MDNNIQLVQALLRQKQIGELKEVVPVNQGLSRSTYKIYTDNDVPLIASVKKDPQFFEAYQHATGFQQFLNENNFPCPAIVADSFFKEENANVTLQEFISGAHKPTYTPQEAAQLGVAIGKMHALGREYNGMVRNQQSASPARKPSFVDRIQRYANYATSLTEFIMKHPLPDKDIIRVLRNGRKYHSHKESGLYGMTHGDLGGDNILYDAGRAKLIDFEWAGIRPLTADISLCGIRNKLCNRDLFPSFLKAYTEERPMSKEELLLLPYDIESAIGREMDSFAFGFGLRGLWGLPAERAERNYNLAKTALKALPHITECCKELAKTIQPALAR